MGGGGGSFSVHFHVLLVAQIFQYNIQLIQRLGGHLYKTVNKNNSTYLFHFYINHLKKKHFEIL